MVACAVVLRCGCVLRMCLCGCPLRLCAVDVSLRVCVVAVRRGCAWVVACLRLRLCSCVCGYAFVVVCSGRALWLCVVDASLRVKQTCTPRRPGQQSLSKPLHTRARSANRAVGNMSVYNSLAATILVVACLRLRLCSYVCRCVFAVACCGCPPWLRAAVVSLWLCVAVVCCGCALWLCLVDLSLWLRVCLCSCVCGYVFAVVFAFARCGRAFVVARRDCVLRICPCGCVFVIASL